MSPRLRSVRQGELKNIAAQDHEVMWEFRAPGSLWNQDTFMKILPKRVTRALALAWPCPHLSSGADLGQVWSAASECNALHFNLVLTGTRALWEDQC